MDRAINVNLRIQPELYTFATNASKACGISRTEFINQALRRYMETRKDLVDAAAQIEAAEKKMPAGFEV